jgi:hypothetical protein
MTRTCSTFINLLSGWEGWARLNLGRRLIQTGRSKQLEGFPLVKISARQVRKPDRFYF